MILINAIVFLASNIVSQIFFGGQDRMVFEWLGLPAAAQELLQVPWTILTYMFMHGGLWHLVFNMYMLYWFGRIFGDFMGEKRLAGLYFLGGIAGGLLYVVIYNILMLSGEQVQGTVLVGASAAVMAITIAAGTRFPDFEINLLFIGPVRLKYVALVLFILSTVLDFSNNMGGKIAHLGGAAIGFFYARQIDRGKDYALGVYTLFEKIKNAFKRAPKLKVVPSEMRASKPSKGTGNANGKEVQAKTDAILDKISKSGYENLSKEEKDFLFKLGNK